MILSCWRPEVGRGCLWRWEVGLNGSSGSRPVVWASEEPSGEVLEFGGHLWSQARCLTSRGFQIHVCEMGLKDST